MTETTVAVHGKHRKPCNSRKLKVMREAQNPLTPARVFAVLKLLTTVKEFTETAVPIF